MQQFNKVQHPLPPFTLESANQKARAAEDAWNRQDLIWLVQACTEHTVWRDGTHYFYNKGEVQHFLQHKWETEQDYRLASEIWGTRQNRMAVRFVSEWHNLSGQWFRSFGNEVLEFNEMGLLQRRYASINDLPIQTHQRLFLWSGSRRPDDHPGLTELGL